MLLKANDSSQTPGLAPRPWTLGKLFEVKNKLSVREGQMLRAQLTYFVHGQKSPRRLGRTPGRWKEESGGTSHPLALLSEEARV